MKTFTREKQYKARDPYETITMIRNILADCDLFVSENNTYFSEPDLASVRVWLSDPDISDGDFGTNGKGMTPRYALASAYGEMMERLQSFALFGDYALDAGFKGKTPHFVAPDEVMMSASECFEQAEDMIAPLMRFSEKDAMRIKDSEKMPCVPFYDVFGEKTVYLPYNTLKIAVSTNGLCAGNTFKEAVTQGLSEIFERYALLLAYRDEPEIKMIEPAMFAGSDIAAKLENLRLYGYGPEILDLSVGKGLPVIGLKLKAGRAAAFRAGADPCPVTSLERCLTELFQGNEEEIYGKFKTEGCRPYSASLPEYARHEINEEAINYHVDGSGKTAHCIYDHSDKYAEEIPGTNAVSEDEDFKYMVDLVKKLGFKLYIRDWSFLGFPSYQIIVPEMSNYDLIYENGLEMYNLSFERPMFHEDRFTDGVTKRLNTLFEKYERNVPKQGGW